MQIMFKEINTPDNAGMAKAAFKCSADIYELWTALDE
jgi:hypothetical protein